MSSSATNAGAEAAAAPPLPDGNNNAKDAASSSSSPSFQRHRRQKSTFENQNTLPKLPIPTLEETMKRFPRAVAALQSTEEERAETERLCREFLQEGAELQKLLCEYSQGDESPGSYVEEFWNEAYLAPDTSVVLNLNPYFVLEEGPDPKLSKDFIGRAASLTFAVVKFASSLKMERVTPDVFKGRALCMDQFRMLFGSCRIPKASQDAVDVYPDSNHVVVMCCNQMYYVQVLWPQEGDDNGEESAAPNVAVNEADLRHILTAIYQDASQRQKESPLESAATALGVLTTLSRKSWALARERLVEHASHNEDALRIVDSALFVLVLDDYCPATVDDAAANMLHGHYRLELHQEEEDGDKKKKRLYYQAGTCGNRWYDKLQLIVCRDGTAGINFEHSAMDGHTALRLASDVVADTICSFAETITRNIYGSGVVPPVISATVRRRPLAAATAAPRRLDFVLPESVRQDIFFAETNVGDQIVSCDTVVLEFSQFGKTLIVTNKVSPDSFVQISMLLAYYQLYGAIVCQYEPVMTKRFYHGRTEAMRTATMEAAEFCRSWASLASAEQRLDALRHVTQIHSSLVKEAAEGKGVDRHLYALSCLAAKKEWPTPAFFQSKAWKLLNHTVLSTSNCGNPALRLFGFGPVVSEGFGIGYIIKDDGLHFTISSKHRQTKRYAQSLEQTLLEMGQCLTPLAAVAVKATKEQHITTTTTATTPPPAMEYLDGFDTYGESIKPVVESRPPPTTTTTTTTTTRPARNLPSRVIWRTQSVSREALLSVGTSVGASSSLPQKQRRSVSQSAVQGALGE